VKVETGSVAFGPISGRGPQVVDATVIFPTEVKTATALLTGFIAEFSAHNDHHLGQLDIQIAVARGGIKGRNVEVKATLGLRDWSGEWDDMYDGQIFFAVLAE
jgi:hypothetical protein